MQRHIAIGMRLEPVAVGNGNTAKHDMIALIEGIPRTASVRAETKTSFLTVSRRILETNAPLLRAKVLANVAHQTVGSLLKADEEINRLRAEVERLSAGAT